MSGRKYGHLMLHLIYYTGRLTAAAWLVGFIFFGMNFKARMENVIILTVVYSTSIQALQYSELYDKFSFHFLVLLLVFVTTGCGAATSEKKLKNFDVTFFTAEIFDQYRE